MENLGLKYTGFESMRIDALTLRACAVAAANSTAHELAPWVLARSICLDDLCLQLGQPAFHDELLLHLGLAGASRCGPLL